MANRITATERRRQKLQLEISDLSGGFISQAALYNVDYRFLSDVQNMELIQGMWQKRKGFRLSGSYTAIDPVPGKVRGAHIYSDQGNLHLLVACEDTLYASRNVTGEGKGKAFPGKVPYSPTVSFSDFRNACYIAHGEGSLLKFNGDKVNDISAPKGNILASYDNRLLMAGIKGDPLVVYFSRQGDGDNWDALNYIALDGKSGERITALLPMLGKLFIFTNHSIYSLVGTMDNFAVSLEISGVGAISNSAIYAANNRFYFISSDHKIYEFDGGSHPVEISTHISHYLNSNFTGKALEEAVFTHYNDSIWITMNNSYLPDNRVTLVYYPAYKAWSRFKGIPAAKYIYVGNSLYFIGSDDIGSIYQYGTHFNDDYKAIEGYLTTTEWSFDALENLKRFKIMYLRGAIQSGGGNGFDVEFWIEGTRVASVRVTSDIASETEIWGENTWGDLYWGSASETSGAIWGQLEWGDSEWNGAKTTFSPRWGSTVWNSFKWGDQKRGSLRDDVGDIYRKIFLNQYNIISGKTLQLVFRDNTPNHGFRFENMVLEYIQKGAR